MASNCNWMRQIQSKLDMKQLTRLKLYLLDRDGVRSIRREWKPTVHFVLRSYECMHYMHTNTNTHFMRNETHLLNAMMHCVLPSVSSVWSYLGTTGPSMATRAITEWKFKHIPINTNKLWIHQAHTICLWVQLRNSTVLSVLSACFKSIWTETDACKRGWWEDGTRLPFHEHWCKWKCLKKSNTEKRCDALIHT